MGKSYSKDDTEKVNGTEKQTLKKSLTLMLLGKSGHGKSCLGNCILGSKAFEVGTGTSSQTADLVCACLNSESCLLNICDGPGLQDTKFSILEDRERAASNMSLALKMCSGGIDAFLVVFRFDARFTVEEVSVLKTLQAHFGEDYLKRAIVVLTHGDLFDTEDMDFDDWCKRQTGPFRELYEACDGRFVLFNNKEKDVKKQLKQKEQLTQLAYRLKLRHGCYTMDCFNRALSERQREIITMKEPILKAYIHKKASFLSSEILRYRDQPRAEQRAEIEKAIHKLKNELQTEDKGHGLLKDLMNTVEDVERNLHDVTELFRLCEKLKNTMKAADIWNDFALSGCVTGGLASLIFPPAIVPIFLCVNIVNIIGKGIIISVGITTVTKMKTTMYNIESRHQKLKKI